MRPLVRLPWGKCITSSPSVRFPQISLHRDFPHSTNRPATPWLRQKQSNGTSIYWLQESIWLHRPWSPSNETECLWDMWPWTKLPTQQSEWTQTVRSHWRMSLPPMNCNGWSTTREHTGLHYVSPVHQRPTLSNSAFYRLYLWRWHHFQFLIRRDRLLGITLALRQDLDDLSQWSAANKMVTNAAKTKCLLVTRKRITNKIADSSLNLHLGNSNIEQVDSQKLLGLTIDRQLGFNIYVEELCKKLSNE